MGKEKAHKPEDKKGKKKFGEIKNSATRGKKPEVNSDYGQRRVQHQVEVLTITESMEIKIAKIFNHKSTRCSGESRREVTRIKVVLYQQSQGETSQSRPVI